MSTSHLSRDVLMEMAEAEAGRVDRRAAGEAHPHLAECVRCRQRFEDARGALALVRDIDVPEPSPLFWDHFSARVHDGLASEEGERAASRPPLSRLAWWPVAFAVLFVLVASVAVWRAGREGPPVSSSAGLPARSAPQPAALQGESGAASAQIPSEEPLDASWRLVADAMSATDFDTAVQAGGFALQPGAAERAALQLSPEEQREVVRLLQAAVDRPE